MGFGPGLPSRGGGITSRTAGCLRSVSEVASACLALTGLHRRPGRFGRLEEETGDRVETVFQAAEVGGAAEVHAARDGVMACSPSQVAVLEELAGLDVEGCVGSGQGVDGVRQRLTQAVNGGDR